jgi:phage-related baseplate assembly protein
MTDDPRTQDEIYRSIRDRLTSSIAGLTNFTERSFNYIFTQAYASELRELELQAVAARLSGYIDYADGNLDQDDLSELGIDDVVSDPAEINQYMTDDNLDALVEELGISRGTGDFATGEVQFTTQSQLTQIPEGTVITTELDSAGEALQFETTEDAQTEDGVTVVSNISIQSVEVGDEYNLPEGEIVRVQSPPVGVTGVINTTDTTGGSDAETNDQLRARAKQAVASSSLGGTVSGIRSYIRQTVEGVTQGNIIIDESTDTAPPFVDVIVDGGADSDVEQAIEESRPTGIRHNLVRPKLITVGIDATLVGGNISTLSVINSITDYLSSLGLGDDYFNNEAVRTILNADSDIVNIENLDAVIESVSEEKFIYEDSVNKYRLSYTYDDTYGTISIEDEDGVTYIEGTDFEVIDDTGDGFPETISWIGSTPDNNEQFKVSYDVTVIGETIRSDWYTTSDVRDEEFIFMLDFVQEFEYSFNQPTYSLDGRPFDGTVEIVELDDSGTVVSDPFVEGESWQLAPLGSGGTEDVFTFDSTQSNYSLTEPFVDGGIAVIDSNKNIYRENTDYVALDSGTDGVLDFISWDTDIGSTVADDGGVLTDETSAATNDTVDDMTLLPSTPATGDAYYFGNVAEFDTFDITISTAGDGTWSIVWEYYDGSSWSSLSSVSDGTSGFTTGGTNTVTWDTPVDWSQTTIDGDELYWVRARVDTYSSITTQPLGQEVLFGEEPADGSEITVNYGCCKQTVRWDQSGDEPVPTNGAPIRITYDKQSYETEYEIVESKTSTIIDASGNSYDEGTDYELYDADGDNENDSILWIEQPATLDSNEAFYFSYVTEGDLFVESREKITPGTVSIE